MKKCPYCFTEMDLRASRCPACRHRVGKAKKNGVAQKYYNVGLAILFVITSLFIFGMIMSVFNGSRTPSSREHVSFTVAGQDKTAVSIVVSPGTTTDQLKDLISVFKEARVTGSLSKLIPATTKGGSMGDYGIIWVFVFSDTEWASRDQMIKFIDGSDRDFCGDYVKHIRAEYYYSLSDEHGNIGFNDGTNSNDEYSKIF